MAKDERYVLRGHSDIIEAQRFCFRCRHARMTVHPPVCGHPDLTGVDPVMGKILFAECSDLRRDGGPCGLEGESFEPRDGGAASKNPAPEAES